MTQTRDTERHPSSSFQQSQWTVGLILNATLEVDGFAGKMGTPERESTLRKLQADSIGKPVNVVVQASEPNPDYKKGDSEANKVLLHRFVIHDGKLDELPSPKSDGLANNVTSFLKFLDQKYPAKHQALSLLMHGGSVEGTAGDDGGASLSELEKAIAKGIGPGKKLDVLDFDACLMSSRPVVAQMSKVVNQMIASEELEQAWPKSNMNLQDTNAWIDRLYDNPSLNTKEFADAAVEIASANERSQDSSLAESSKTVFFHNLATLTHFDLEKYPQFEKSFDQAANALSLSANDPRNKAVYSSLFEKTPAFGHFAESQFHLPSSEFYTRQELRDLRSFSQATQKMIESGQIQDPNDAVKQSLKALDQSEQALQAKTFTAEHGMHEVHDGVRVHYSALGGMSVFLPGSDFDNVQENVKDKTYLGAFISTARSVIDAQHSATPTESSKLNLMHLAAVAGDIVTQAATDPLAEAVARKLVAQTAKAAAAAYKGEDLTPGSLQDMYETAKQLQGIGPFRAELEVAEAPSEAHYQQERNEDAAAGGEAWDKFVDIVRSH